MKLNMKSLIIVIESKIEKLKPVMSIEPFKKEFDECFQTENDNRTIRRLESLNKKLHNEVKNMEKQNGNEQTE